METNSYLQEDDEVLKNEASEAWKQRKEELEKVEILEIFKFTLIALYIFCSFMNAKCTLFIS